MVQQCGVHGCRKSLRMHPHHTFFCVPRDPNLRAKWLSFAGVEKSGADFRICIDHFDPKYVYKTHPRRLLARDSIPTIKPAESTSTNESVTLIESITAEPSTAAKNDFHVSENPAVIGNTDLEPSTVAENNFQVSDNTALITNAAYVTMDTDVK